MKQVNLIKIGSDAVVCKDNRSIKKDVVEKLFDDILRHERDTGESSIVLSSGAIALGRQLLGEGISDAELFEAGWSELLKIYQEVLGNNKQVSGRLLQDSMDLGFQSDLITKLYLESSLGVMSVLNHDDRLSDSESGKIVSKTDNDFNALRLTRMINSTILENGLYVKRVLFLTNTDGVLDNNGNTVEGFYSMDRESANLATSLLNNFVRDSSSDSGTGGMQSKILHAGKCLSEGAEEVYIANANTGLDCITREGISTRLALSRVMFDENLQNR